MDGDPSIEPELDSLSLFIPLPYRVAIALVLGVWAWGINLHYLHLLKIDLPALIRYPSRSSQIAAPHHLSCYRLATILSVPLTLSLLLFWLVTRGNSVSVRSWEILPNIYLLILVICFFLPFHLASGSGRYRFLTTVRRISVGGLAEVQDGKFGDILLADALTSYAKVLADLFVSLCMFFSRTRSSTGHPDRNCGGQFIVPFLLALPSLIRLRQCLIEYSRVQRANRQPGGGGRQGWGGVHLANALKYASAFPVIILGAMQRSKDPDKSTIGDVTLYRLWLLFVFINSFYCFYWDVAKDWDLSLFSQERHSPEYPWGLRHDRFLHAKEIYYFAIVVDFFLRFTWTFKLSPHLDRFNDMEGGIFLMELLEVFRRWIWIFLRVETEWLRNTRGPANDDVLLTEFVNKMDDD